MLDGAALTWREVVDKHHSALIDELSIRLDADLRDAVSEAVKAGDRLHRSRIESLNQVLRRLRTLPEEDIPALLAEACASFADRLVVLVFEDNQARSAAEFGIAGPVRLETASAPAIVAAIDSRDPVIALATDAEISPELAAALGAGDDRKAYLFPVVARQSVMAMLVASGVALSAPLELLCEAAGIRLESTLQKSSASPGLVQPVPQAGSSNGSAPAARRRGWDELSPEDQRLHLQAQRMARVRVAEMRLYHDRALKSGVAASDIYTALQSEIDAAREQFLQTFLAKSPTMVDYLHLEILRSLAHDDDRMLGKNYPGPMV
jgi:hypothetical protein